MQTSMILWGVVFAAAVIAEIATLQLVTIWFAAGALAAFIAAAIGFSPLSQTIVFTAVSVLLLCATRPLLRKMKVKHVIPTNYDAEVGKLGLVTEEINELKNTGRVKVGGVSWRARTDDETVLPVGASVRVERISGTTVFVVPVQS